MIAAVKGWHAVLSALLFFIPPAATAATADEDANSAARELARKTVALAGKGETLLVIWRNVSSLGPAEWNQARAAFEAALKESGGRLSDAAGTPPAPFEARLTLSENRTQYLLVEELRKGDDRQVWIASWKRTGPLSLTAPAITLEKNLVWEQDEPMLDVAFPAGAMLVLSPSRLTLYTRQAAQWTAKHSVPLAPARPWPRDLRGRLRLNSATVQAYLPGMLCGGTVDAALDPGLSLTCRPSEEAWVLESGSRALLLGAFAPARNYFDGRVTSQSGQRKTIAPFYSAAAVEEQGRTLWLLAMVDGRTQMFDATLDPLGALSAAWGSDLAGAGARCGGGSQVLATRPGDGTVLDAVQAFAIVDRAPAALTAPAEFPGPVVALWSSGGAAAMAIVRNLATGKYESYTLTISCS
jgi:hypothetical protein